MGARRGLREDLSSLGWDFTLSIRLTWSSALGRSERENEGKDLTLSQPAKSRYLLAGGGGGGSC